MKGIIRIIILLVCLASWQGIRADNVVTVTGGSGTPGAEIDVSISLTNTDAVSAMQLSIPLVDGVELVENSARIGGRASETHTATVGVKDGNINVFVFSSSMATMSGSNGEVVRFKVRLGKEPSTLALSSSKLILTDTDGNNVSGTVQNGTISIRTAKAEYSTREMDFGRQPILGTYTQRLSVTNVGNEPLTITAFTFSASDFTCKEPLPLTLQAGSSKSITIEYAPQERGEVSEELKVVCNSSSKLNTITLKAAPYAVNELHVEDASGVSDSEILVHLIVNNMDALSGFQFEIPIPEQLEYVPESFALTDRKADHQVTTSVVSGVLKAVCYSLSDKTFTGNDGDIATFKVRIVGRYGTKLSASNAILTANIKGKDINVLSDKYDGYISVVSPVLSAASSVNLGNHPVTQAPSYTYTVRNQGAADLTISRIVFDNDVFAVEGISLPLTIGASKSQTFTVVYKNASVGAHSATMQLYSNDPDRRLLNVDITGSLYSPNYITLSASNVTTSSTADIAVTLSNNLPISGMQFDIQYPSDKYTLDASSFVFEDQMKNYTANVRSMTKDVARVFLYSLTNNSIAVDTAQVMTIKLQPIDEVNVGTYSVSISNLKLGSQNMDDVQSQSTASTSFEVREETFRTDNAAILGKTTSTVKSSDIDAINAALDAYNQLSDEAQARLSTEKALLDSLKAKAEELKAAEEADAAADAEANKFKKDNANILGKTTSTVASSDLIAITKALDDYSKLSDAAQAKLTNGEKAMLDSLKTKAEDIKAAEEADAAATAETNTFKATYADVLSKTIDTVASSDLDAITAALMAYDALSEAAKAKLVDGEKSLLDALKIKAEELKAAEEADAAATAEANAFKTAYVEILGKTVETVVSADLDAITAALTAYDALSEAAKAKLVDGEKSLLDALKVKAEQPQYTLGDVNDDGDIDGYDLVGISNLILGTNTDGLIRDAADVNSDGDVDGYDYVMEVNTILGTNASAAKGKNPTLTENALSALTIPAMNVTAGEKTQLAVGMECNGDVFTLVQTDIEFPEGVKPMLRNGRVVAKLAGECLGGADDHSISCVKQGNGKYRILIASQDNTGFTGKDGQLFTIGIETSKDMLPGMYDITLSNTKLVRANNTGVNPSGITAMMVCNEATGINCIEGDNADELLYNLNGQRVSKHAQRGVYISNGKKNVKL